MWETVKSRNIFYLLLKIDSKTVSYGKNFRFRFRNKLDRVGFD